MFPKLLEKEFVKICCPF